MPPSVAPASQVRRTAAAILRQSRRHFFHPLSRQGGFDNHLARELHARCLQAKLKYAAPVEATQAAMKVADLATEKQPADETQDWVAQVAMQRRHSTTLDAALETVTHDQVRAGAQSMEEGQQACEIVAIVSVAHDHVAAARGQDAAHQGASVPAFGHFDHAGASGLGEQLAPVRAAVVGHENLAVDAVRLQEVNCLPHARGYGL